MRANQFVFVFPGQGAQQVGMGEALAARYPETAGEVFRDADDILGMPISKLCFAGPEEVLAHTEITQPALFTTSVAILRVLQSLGFEPSAAAGHSVGEYAALVAAGAISFQETLPVIRLRGELMASAAVRTPGAMAAVIGLDLAAVDSICRQTLSVGVVEPSNINAPMQIVISGETEAVLHAMDLVAGRGKRAVRLAVSAPFHCSLMQGVRTDFEPGLRTLTIRDPRVPVVANATADYVRTASEIRQALLDQLASPVLWAESMVRLLKDGRRLFLEVGPGRVLAGLMKAIDRSAVIASVGSPNDIEKLISQ